MNPAPSLATYPLQAYPWSEIQVCDGEISLLASQGLNPDSIRMISDQIEVDRAESSTAVPFPGLLACLPCDEQSGLIAHTIDRPNVIRCHVVPLESFPAAVATLNDSIASHDVAPSINNLDRIEPLLRCITAGERIAVSGCEPERTIATTWQMIPPSCRHELTFAAPPFQQAKTSVYFSPEFDSTRLGPEGASVMLDLSKGCPVDMSDLSLGWSIAMHSQLFADNPAEAIREFFGSHCNSASLTDLEYIAEQWCDQDDARIVTPITPNALAMFPPCHADATPDVDPCDESGFVFSVDSMLAPETPTHNDSIIEQLGQLDDAVFDAIAGSNDGISRMRKLWPSAQGEIAPHLIEESREHYLRYVVNEWTQRFGEDTDPAACLPTIEVMRILLGDDEDNRPS